MLYGGTLFGIVDHIWHGELFLISESITMDLFLGCAITATIFACWGIILGLARISRDLCSAYPVMPRETEIRSCEMTGDEW